MRSEILWVCSISWLVSLVLIARLVRSSRTRLYKVFHAALLLTPVVGPLVYWFVTDATPPQQPSLKNDLPRGTYTHYWISLNAALGRDRKGQAGPDPNKPPGA